MTEEAPTPLTGPVEVVGTGLIGTSIALVCRRLGLDVVLRDTSAEHVRTATGLGAGRAVTSADRPQLVVVAVRRRTSPARSSPPWAGRMRSSRTSAASRRHRRCGVRAGAQGRPGPLRRFSYPDGRQRTLRAACRQCCPSTGGRGR
ncbi:hypothetical protein K9U39_20445 [Rhodoblastus acidophilus]|nr:hypothetical protein [Rhodoblastus acidophilus]